MTATAIERLTKFAGLIPARGTFGCAAAVNILKGTIVTLDSSENADTVAAGQDAIGVAESTIINALGAANDEDVEVLYGVHGFLVSGTTPKARQTVYVVDNQTVSLDPAGGRGIAGICTESRTESGTVVCYVYMGPHVVAAVRSGQDLEVPLGNFRLSTGAALPAFAGGSADGFTLADSEAFGIRFNDDTTSVITANVRVPESVPVGAPATLHVLASRVGATDTAVALLTPALFANRDGVAYDAGGNLVTGNFGVMAGATKVVHELTKAIDQNSGLNGGDVLTLTLTPITANLANDDLVIHAVWISVP